MENKRTAKPVNGVKKAHDPHNLDPVCHLVVCEGSHATLQSNMSQSQSHNVGILCRFIDLLSSVVATTTAA